LIPYSPPEFNKTEFNCPHCNSYSDQYWQQLTATHDPLLGHGVPGFNIGRCRKCSAVSIWKNHLMIYPEILTMPEPPKDLPADLVPEYEEARNVLSKSPRASCALLRLCIEKMCDLLEPGTSSLNSKIGKLVEKNKIDVEVQRALDSVRVIGDNAIHPLHMDLKDDAKTAFTLFELIQVIVQSTFTRKKLIDDMYKKLPENAKKQIVERDSSKS